MTVSLRLDDELAARLNRAAAAAGVSKSEYIRQCLNSQLEEGREQELSAYELGKDLFGCYSSGDGTLSERVHEVVREQIDAKYAKRRGR
jgi:RHH-type transcriptional regulator, rel operon repressor / antitoxin RelB